MGDEVTIVGWGSATVVAAHHPVNQDTVLAGPAVFAVADGMGGHVAGARASELAISALAAIGPPPVSPADVAQAIERASLDIVATGSAVRDLAGMGTTLAGLALVREGPRDLWLVFNVGDSRVYRLHEGTLRRVTVDHSLVQELVDSGDLTRDQAAVDPRRNVLTRALGSNPPAKVDFHYLVPVEGERFVICSDGVTTVVTDAEISRLATIVARPDEAARALVAVAAGSAPRDDISAVLVDTVRAQPSTVSHDTVVVTRPVTVGE